MKWMFLYDMPYAQLGLGASQGDLVIVESGVQHACGRSYRGLDLCLRAHH
jgi:hypothetical protein